MGIDRKPQRAFAKEQKSIASAQADALRRPGISLSAQSPFAPKTDDDAKLMGRPMSTSRVNANSFSAPKPEGGTRQGTGIFAGRNISALGGGNSLLDRWDAGGSLTGGKSIGRPTPSPAFGSTAGVVAATRRPTAGYDPSLTGEDYGGLKDALAMGGGSPDLMQPALIAATANRTQDETELEAQRRMDEELYGVSLNG